MKLTWFGGTTLRIHIGGRILVSDLGRIEGVDTTEVASGSDAAFRIGADGDAVDLARWHPRRGSGLSEAAAEVRLYRAEGASLVDAVGEPPLLIVTGPVAEAGRWGRDAVVVALGPDAESAARTALERLGPRLLALGIDEPAVPRVFAALRDRLEDTVLVALEPGMALEV